MSKQIKFKDIPKFLQDSFGSLRKTRPFFLNLGNFMDREVQKTFMSVKSSGGADQRVYNRTIWRGYSQSTLHPVDYKGFPETSKWRPRMGTDGSKGKYSANSKLNQKSGFFRKSWGISQLDDRHMLYGSDHPLVYDLIKDRPVINYDQTMRDQFSTLWREWVKTEIKKAMAVPV